MQYTASQTTTANERRIFSDYIDYVILQYQSRICQAYNIIVHGCHTVSCQNECTVAYTAG